MTNSRRENHGTRWVPHSLSPAQKVACVEASTEILRILQESEWDNFDGTATGDESWFRYIYQSSEIFACSPADVIPRTRQAMGAKKIMMTLFFTGRRLIVLDIMPRGSKCNQRLLLVIYFQISKKKSGVSHAASRVGFLGAHGQFNGP